MYSTLIILTFLIPDVKKDNTSLTSFYFSVSFLRYGASTSKVTSVKVGDQLISPLCLLHKYVFLCSIHRFTAITHRHTPLVEKHPPRAEQMSSTQKPQPICHTLNGYLHTKPDSLTAGWAPSAETTTAHIAQFFFPSSRPPVEQLAYLTNVHGHRKLWEGCTEK